MTTLLRCSCGVEFSSEVAGREWTELRNEAVATGWHCTHGAWRCSGCYSKWEATEMKRRSRTADARKEAVVAP